MTSGRDWLYERLRSEPVHDGEHERWNSIVSRLRPLTAVDESTKQSGHDQLNSLKLEAAQDHRDQFISRAGEQGEGRSWAKTNPPEKVVRGNVGALREIRPEPEIMNAGERRLVSLAAALIGDAAGLSIAEIKLVARAPPVDSHLIAHARAQILAGQDLLGTEFSSLRSAKQRRQRGATYTPTPIVDAMVAWARAEISTPARVVDPGAGSGRFLIAAAHKFPDAELIAVDVDPLAALMLRANAAVHGFADRLVVHLVDYRSLALPGIARPTLFIGNPPYVRHHNIGEQWKTWFAATANRFGFTASTLAGLHIHFFLKTRELAQPGDYGAFITAAEWLDVNYGSVLRRMLADGLGGTAVHIIDPKAQPFADALTTGAITCFRVGSRPTEITMRLVGSLDDLAPLSRGRAVAWHEMASARKWSVLVREQKQAPAGFIELGELFRVHRGQVTGGNDVWIDNDAAHDVPKQYKPFTVTSARELLTAGAELTSTKGLHRVIDLPAELDTLDVDERKAVQRFLAWAKRHGAHEGYVATHRRAWWSVGLRAPAPILCTYMARRAPAFVRNQIKARHINIAHGLYPREPLSDAASSAVLAYLRRHMSTTGGRTYAGGLVKFEPKELERILLPRVEDIHGYLAEREAAAPQALDGSGVGIRCGHRQEHLPR
jgi:adenine-specific DNA-methyltransferase